MHYRNPALLLLLSSITLLVGCAMNQQGDQEVATVLAQHTQTQSTQVESYARYARASRTQTTQTAPTKPSPAPDPIPSGSTFCWL